MSTEAMELIAQMEKAATLDEAVNLQRRALAYVMGAATPEDAKAARAVTRAGDVLLKRMMTAHNAR